MFLIRRDVSQWYGACLVTDGVNNIIVTDRGFGVRD